MSFTSGLSSHAWIVGPGRAQNTLSTPGGAPNSFRAGTTNERSAYMTPSGALRGARTTTAFPASSGVMPNSALAAGAFCGGFTHTTPSGTRRTISRRDPCRNSWYS